MRLVWLAWLCLTLCMLTAGVVLGGLPVAAAFGVLWLLVSGPAVLVLAVAARRRP